MVTKAIKLGSPIKPEDAAEPSRSRWARRQTRIDRLRSLEQPPRGRAREQTYDAQLNATRQLLWQRHQPSAIYVRRDVLTRPRFLTSWCDPADPADEREPLIRALMAPNGVAVQTLLICLFEVACRAPRAQSRRTEMPLDYRTSSADVCWVDLIGVALQQGRPAADRSVSPHDKRLRSIKNALRRLEEHKLVEFTSRGPRDRYERFRLLREGADYSRSSTPVNYTIPAAHAAVSLPVEFFLNGWAHMLTEAEIALWLTLRLLAHEYQREHRDNGVYLDGDLRRDRFGFDRAGYEAHQQLAAFGLIHTVQDPRRRPDGTVDDYTTDGPGGLHRFQVTDAGLQQVALPTVLKAL